MAIQSSGEEVTAAPDEVPQSPDSVEEAPPDSSDQEDAIRRHELYIEYARDLALARNKSFEAFDQAVLTLSSAALGLSIAFIKNLVGDLHLAVAIPTLVASWLAFGVAILSTMTSFITSRVAIDAQARLAEVGLLQGDDDALQQVPLAARWTAWLNGLSAVAFAAGIVTTIVFVILNVLGG